MFKWKLTLLLTYGKVTRSSCVPLVHVEDMYCFLLAIVAATGEIIKVTGDGSKFFWVNLHPSICCFGRHPRCHEDVEFVS